MEPSHEIAICLGSSCYSRNNKVTVDIVKNYIIEKGISANVFFHGNLCTNNCQKGPILTIDDKVYEKVTPHNIREILDNFFITLSNE